MSQHPFRTVVVVTATVAAVGIGGLAGSHLMARTSRANSSPARPTRTAGGPAAAVAASSPTPATTPTDSPSAVPTSSSGKTSPPSPPPSPVGKYPYPLDAGATVVTGPLSLDPAQLAGGAAATITVTAGKSGWLTGQEIFVYLGQQYELTLAGPGASGEFTIPAGSVGSSGVVVSGFQFPSNNPEAPIAGYGTATLRVG